MITPDILAIIMFISTLLLLLFGFPVAFTLAGSALIFAFIGELLDIFNFRMLFFFPQRIYGVMINEALVAVPLFIFMGVMLEKTNIAGKLLESIGDLFGSIRGGLGIGVVLVGMLLAASTGIVGPHQGAPQSTHGGSPSTWPKLSTRVFGLWCARHP